MHVDASIGLTLGLAVAFTAPAFAQTTSYPGALPQGVAPDQVRAMTPDQARARYQSLDPNTKAALHDAAEQARKEYANDPGTKAWLKNVYKSWKGQ
jgi:hypothetical protein